MMLEADISSAQLGQWCYFIRGKLKSQPVTCRLTNDVGGLARAKGL